MSIILHQKRYLPHEMGTRIDIPLKVLGWDSPKERQKALSLVFQPRNALKIQGDIMDYIYGNAL